MYYISQPPDICIIGACLMERKSPALFAKGLVTFCLVVGPFLLIGLFLNTANVSELFTEFAHLVFGNPGAVTPVTLYWDSIPTLFLSPWVAWRWYQLLMT